MVFLERAMHHFWRNGKNHTRRRRQRHVNTRTGGLALVGALCFLLLLPAVNGSPYGLGREANEGCLCHTPVDSTGVQLTGLPDAYEANTSYPLTLTIVSEVVSVENESQGGFRMTVSNGTLVHDESEVQFLDGGWTHRLNGTYQRVWNVNWISPPDTTSRTDFVVNGNAVNGNGDTSGDAWATSSYAIGGVDFDGELTPSEGIDGLDSSERILLLVVLVGIVALLWTTSRR